MLRERAAGWARPARIGDGCLGAERPHGVHEAEHFTAGLRKGGGALDHQTRTLPVAVPPVRVDSAREGAGRGQQPSTVNCQLNVE